MTSTSRSGLAFVLFFCLGGVACHRSAPAQATGMTGPESDGTSADADARSSATAVGPARCRATEWTSLIVADAGGAELELGDATAFGDGVAVAVVHRIAGDRVAAVALVHPDADASARVVDLGPTLGDEPPPRLAVAGGELLVAFHPVARSGGADEVTRPLALRSIAADGSAASLFSIDEQRDDSLASDVTFQDGHGLVVWDEATREPRGVIRAQPMVGRQRAGGAVELTPKDSDAEAPRVVPLGKSFAVTWIARGPEPQGAPTDASDPEAPGEPRSRGWIEMIVVDEHGVATNPVRRLTPVTGHVSAYDVRAGAATSSHLLVVARDDGEAVDGAGGTLLRVRVGPEGAEPPVAFPTDGLGRGAPMLVDGPAGWLAWVGPGEQLRMLSLDATGTPSGKPSAEEGLDDARPVLSLPSGRLLVEKPSDSARPLRTFACVP
jgi:hypothetical protein